MLNSLRSWLASRDTKPKTVQKQKNQKLHLMELEDRSVPAVEFIPFVEFQELGPSPITDAFNVIPSNNGPNSVQSGAINSVAVDPTNPKHVFVATVNGGIWETDNIDTQVWFNTTDQLESLSIGSVAFNPLNPNIIYAGTGLFTAGAGGGGANIGIYRSTDGGTTWQNFGRTEFAGNPINKILPTAINGGLTVFAVSQSGGVFRSDDAGESWLRISGANGLPNVGFQDIVVDPTNPNVFYAGSVSGSTLRGIFRLDATGGNQTWTNVTGNLPSLFGTIRTGFFDLEMAISGAGAVPLWIALVDIDPFEPAIPNDYSGAYLHSVYRGVFNGTAFDWQRIGPGADRRPPDVSPGGQGTLHLSIAADPLFDTIVYVGGDRRENSPFAGNIARGDSITNNWTSITARGAKSTNPQSILPLLDTVPSTTAPHADSRFMIFADNNTLLQVDDGGIYLATNPRGENNQPVSWSSRNGNLAITELYRGAFDSSNVRGFPFAGSQDNGTSEIRPNASGWTEFLGGDGMVALADDVGARYFSFPNFGIFRQDADGTITSLPATINGANNQSINPNNPNRDFIDVIPFLPTAKLNNVARDRLFVLSGNFPATMYYSTDRGNTFSSVGGIVGTDPNFFPMPLANVTGFINAATVGHVDVNGFGLSNSAFIGTTNGVFFTTDLSGGGGGVLMGRGGVALPEPVVDIAYDPFGFLQQNGLILLQAYVVTTTRVFRIDVTFNQNDVANTLTVQAVDITGNVNDYTVADNQGRRFTSIAIYFEPIANPPQFTKPGFMVPLVGTVGGVIRYLPDADEVPNPTSPNNREDWFPYGFETLPNVIPIDMEFDINTNNFLVTTYGRGAFLMTNVSQNIRILDTLRITGDSGTNNIVVRPDPTNPAKLLVSDGITPEQQVSRYRIQNVQINAGNGDDTIFIGTNGTNGNTTSFVEFPVNIVGGFDNDTLIVDNTGAPTSVQVTVTSSTIGVAVAPNNVLPDTMFDANTFTGQAGVITYAGFRNLTVRTGNFNDIFYVPSVIATNNRFEGNGGEEDELTGPNRFNNWVVNDQNGTINNDIVFTSFRDLTGGTSTDNFTFNNGTGTSNTVRILDGGAGNDTARFNGRAGNENVVLNFDAQPFSAQLEGMGQLLRSFNLENNFIDGAGGINNLTINDRSNISYGSLADPINGWVYRPNGADSGTISLSNNQLRPTTLFDNVNGTFTVAGDVNIPTDRDFFTFLGLSTNGQGTSFGEFTTEDGSDTIVVDENGISITNATLGALRSVNLAKVNGQFSFSGILLRSGNEAPTKGDNVTASTSANLSIFVDGGAPGGSRLGDRITVNRPNPTTQTATGSQNGLPVFTVTDQVTGGQLQFTGFEPTQLSPTQGSTSTLVAATNAGTAGVVRVYNGFTKQGKFDVVPYGAFAGGIRVAAGDINGDLIPDVVTAPGVGGGPHIKVYDGVTGQEIRSFFAYAPVVTNGVFVAVGDINGDGFGDIITGVGAGAGPHVRVFDGISGAELASFFAYVPNFTGGISVASGDVNGDGFDDIVTGAGPGGGPHVQVFDGQTFQSIQSYFAYDPAYLGGISVATGDLNGDRRSDVITAPMAFGAPQVRAFDGVTQLNMLNFFANPQPIGIGSSPPQTNIPQQAGVNIASADTNEDGIDEIIVGNGFGNLPRVFVFNVTPLQELTDFLVFDSNFGGGIFVGAAK